VSTKVPGVIESLRASCSGNGIVFMFKVAMSTMDELSVFQVSDIDTRRHTVWARLAFLSVYVTSIPAAPGAETLKYVGKFKPPEQRLKRGLALVRLSPRVCSWERREASFPGCRWEWSRMGPGEVGGPESGSDL